MKNKEYHHGGFQQQSLQRLIDKYGHMNSQNYGKIIRLKAKPLGYYFIN